ncbi:MAG: DUF484 family protein [Alteromonadaceae bacterium]|nr:DUF484 family protein [Alteromonadaceae bacterium]
MSQHVLTPEQVAEYLIDNPSFFVENPEVLPELKLPNLHSGTVSLVELQTDQLRQQLHQQRQELAQLISHADHNEQLFQIFASLMQSLYVCESINEVQEALSASFSGELAFTNFALQVFVTQPDLADFQHHKLIEKRFKKSDFFFGRLAKDEVRQIFNDKQVGSCALILLGTKEKLGLLALGSKDPSHFHPDMDTLFLLPLKQLLEQVLLKVRT